MLRDLVRRTDSDDLAVGDEHRAVFDDAEFAHLRAAAWAGVAGRAAQGQELRGMSEKSGGRMLVIGMQIFLALVANSRSLDMPGMTV